GDPDGEPQAKGPGEYAPPFTGRLRLAQVRAEEGLWQCQGDDHGGKRERGVEHGEDAVVRGTQHPRVDRDQENPERLARHATQAVNRRVAEQPPEVARWG